MSARNFESGCSTHHRWRRQPCLQFGHCVYALEQSQVSVTPGILAALLALSVSRSEEHTSELQSQSNLVCRLLLEKKKIHNIKVNLLIHPLIAKITIISPSNYISRQQC